MKIGVPAEGETASRAAHSLAAHPLVEELVIVGPATSRYYRVVDDPSGCDLLVVTGPDAPERHVSHGIPMVWDGPGPRPGVVVWAASPVGLALAMAEREDDPTLVAAAHPALGARTGERLRFPDPVGRVAVSELEGGGRRLHAGGVSGSDAAVMVRSRERSVAIVDDAGFMSGVTLAAGIVVADGTPKPVWEAALDYMNAVTQMGLVMAESAAVAG